MYAFAWIVTFFRQRLHVLDVETNEKNGQGGLGKTIANIQLLPRASFCLLRRLCQSGRKKTVCSFRLGSHWAPFGEHRIQQSFGEVAALLAGDFKGEGME